MKSLWIAIFLFRAFCLFSYYSLLDELFWTHSFEIMYFCSSILPKYKEIYKSKVWIEEKC